MLLRCLCFFQAFTSALSTSFESVQGLAIPSSVRQQLERQAAKIDDHARHAQVISRNTSTPCLWGVDSIPGI